MPLRRNRSRDEIPHVTQWNESAQAQLSWDPWTDQYERAAEADKVRRNAYVLNHFYSPQTYLARFLISIRKVDEPVDMDAYVARIPETSRALLKAAAREARLAHWGPAYAELIAWLESDRPNSDVIATGVGKNPNGQAFCLERLADATTTYLTPDEVHQIGLDGVVRVHAEMEVI